MAEAKDIFEAKSQSVQQVLGEAGTGFYIPAYQRHFAWTEDKVEKLLSDLFTGFGQLASDEDTFSFLGTIIFVHDTQYKTIDPLVKSAVPSKVLVIIDGQQRLSTLITLAVALHSEISSRARKLKLLHPPQQNTPEREWLRLQTSEVLGYLEDCFRFEKIKGGGHYPRIIRAFEDQWSDVTPIYSSPVARLTSLYSEHLDAKAGTKFKTSEKADLFERFRYMQKYIVQLAERQFRNAEKVVDPLENLDVATLADSERLQVALVKFELPQEVKDMLKSGSEEQFVQLSLLVLYSYFVLRRVAVTAVQGRNEQYAFEVFESLNTTGEPLTAYETFKPRVVRAESLEHYGKSASKKAIDRVDAFLHSHKRDKHPVLTSDLLIQFALVESGQKLSSRLTDQRRYLQSQYTLVEDDPAARLKFVEHLRDVAAFQDKAWGAAQAKKPPALEGLNPVSPPDLDLGLAALIDMNHTIAAAPLIRYYGAQLETPTADSRPVAECAKAVVAFSVLWRAATGATSGIDAAYREALRGTATFSGLARGAGSPPPSLSDFKAYLRGALTAKVGGGQADWLKAAAAQPLYKFRSIARLVLLAAYDDACVDTNTPGLIERGKSGVFSFLNVKSLAARFTLEHVAPRKPDPGDPWDPQIYTLPTTVDTIGNLVLVPLETNSILGNKSWTNKAVLYQALGAQTTSAAEAILMQHQGLGLVSSAAEVASHSTYLPQLEALGLRGATGQDWDAQFISLRSHRLLEMCWDRYQAWLT